ncbi:MAG: putative DNA-binding domain-containing protein [Xanthomonadaceae bacterium]|nr:putative DNA-binding domain-containing protein [Xanthomonadaceae bacterium]MDE2278149.1 putative DNA-binding domain-containing protein [Xanthomonadaceae bacterium]MDE2316525.1 putative DNA-binding domain-containing protein [Xanthomonadaceae bacterium]
MPVAPALLELQECFLDALYDDQEVGPSESVVDAGLEPAARLRIYRHNSEQVHLEALRTTYAAVFALVGEAFFEHAVLSYRSAYPSLSGNLQRFGAHFSEFLEWLPTTHRFPYLGDVARLEWRRQAAALAVEAQPLTTAAIGSQLVAMDGPVRIVMHPSVQRFASTHPVLTIWRYAIAPAAERLSLPETGDHLVLWRSGDEVAMAQVDAASFACIDALACGSTLDEAHTAGCNRDSAFDLAACIASLVVQGLVVAIAPAHPEENS